MQRLVLAALFALTLLAFPLVSDFAGTASADEPCKIDCEPVIITPSPNPGGSIVGPVIVVPDIVSIIGPQITFEAGTPSPNPPEISVPNPSPPD